MAYFDLNKIIVRFRIKYPRFEPILNRLTYRIENRLETAATNGDEIIYNEFYMNSLSEEQQLFTFAHEVMHVALNHIDRCLDKDMYYWNLATDAVINDYLRSTGFTLNEKDIDIEGARFYTAEEIYERLIKEDKEKEDDPPEDIQDSDKIGNGKQTNTPSSGNSNDPNKEEDPNKDGNSPGDDNDPTKEEDPNKDGNSNSKDDDPTKEDDSNKNKKSNGKDRKEINSNHDLWEEAAKKHQEEGTSNTNEINEKEEFENNDKEKRKKDDDYLKNGLDGSGSGSPYGPGSGRGRIDGIEGLDDSPICWQDLLKMNYRSNPDWRITEEEEYGVLVEDLEDDESCECEIVIDTSASISKELIRNFLTECLTIAKNNKIRVGFFDTKFYGFHDIRNEDDINELKIEGGGGTNFDPAVEAFTESCPNKIIFTDGYARMPKKEVDANWIVFGDFKHEIHPNGGNVIYINGDEYDALKHKQRTR